MNKVTEVEMPALPYPLSKNTRSVLLGSCFSLYMGERMNACGMTALSNPTGTLFNPSSIAAVVRAMHDEEYVKRSAFYSSAENEWRSWLADTRIKGITREQCIITVQSRLQELKEFISNADYLFLTLGTCVCYQLIENGEVVTNCQRQPDKLFRQKWLSQEECESAIEYILKEIYRLNQDIHVVFTISPFRYKKYGMHGNSISKATLMLAEEAICQKYKDKCTYFPAYEIIMDELRDYRWYADDMVHPAPEAADYIWERLKTIG